MQVQLWLTASTRRLRCTGSRVCFEIFNRFRQIQLLQPIDAGYAFGDVTQGLVVFVQQMLQIADHLIGCRPGILQGFPAHTPGQRIVFAIKPLAGIEAPFNTDNPLSDFKQLFSRLEIIDAGGGNSLTLKDTKLAALDKTDFHFV